MPGTRWGLTSRTPAAEADLPPSISVCPLGSGRDAADRGLPRPDLAVPDVPDAHLSSLHGLALEIRRDNDVSSLSFCIFFFCLFFSSRKETQPKEAGSAPLGAVRREGPAERLAPETLARRQQWRPPRHSTPSVQSNPEGRKKKQKTKKTFLLINFTP